MFLMHHTRKALTVCLAALFATLTLAHAQEELEIFSWWAGNEGPALEALIEEYKADNENANVINATVTGGSGVNARAVLKTRMLGGDPPDSFQVHAGQELIGTWVVADRMQDVSDIYEEQGWMDVFPAELLELVSTENGMWSVPVNIHRSNVMWYVPSTLEQRGVEVPNDWQTFLDTTCPALQDQGVTPLVIGQNWTQQHLWESVALAELGVDGWQALFTGELAFNSPEATAVWDTFGQILECTNNDASGLSWQQATDRVVNGEAAFNIMGDWAMGYMTNTLELTPGEGFGWAASPGTEGVFMLLSDSFGLPAGAPHPENAREWLRLVGSREAQDIFNPIKGSISPRLDSDLSLYNAYAQATAEDYRSNSKVGSLVHGAIAKESFMSEFATALEIYLSSGNSAQAASAAQAIANQTGIGN